MNRIQARIAAIGGAPRGPKKTPERARLGRRILELQAEMSKINQVSRTDRRKENAASLHHQFMVAAKALLPDALFDACMTEAVRSLQADRLDTAIPHTV